jgi:xanthine/CO dehydrogenase XdhC/CoxF family maturation factor
MSIDRSAVRLDTSLEQLLECSPARSVTGALATVVSTAGSTYRKPGARMLIMADGSHVGLLSGGCLETDLVLHAREVIDSGLPRAVEYDMRGPDDLLFGIGAGCEGAMRVLIEPWRPEGRAAEALLEAGRITRRGDAACLAVVHDARELALGTYGAESLPPELSTAAETVLAQAASRDIGGRGALGARADVCAFVQYLAPPPHLLICGAGPDAPPVVAAARALRWRVSVVDHRPAQARADEFPGARVILADAGALRAAIDLDRCHAAVVMSHRLSADIAYLRELAAAGTPAYVGLLGPAARRRRIAQELGALADALRPRLRGPVGTDIGAVTPEAIALAIVSEIHACLAGRLPGATATTTDDLQNPLGVEA